MCIFNNCWKALSWHLPWQLHDYSFSWSKGGHSNTWEKSTYHQEEEMKFYIRLENTYAQPEKFTQGLCSWNLPPSVNTQDSIMILGYSLATFSNLPLPASPVFSVFPSCALFCKLCYITYTSCAPYINKKLWPPHTEIPFQSTVKSSFPPSHFWTVINNGSKFENFTYNPNRKPMM